MDVCPSGDSLDPLGHTIHRYQNISFPSEGGKGPMKYIPMGSEVDNFLKNFYQNIKCSGKTLNRTFKIPSHQEQMILSSSMNDKTYLQGFLEGFLEDIQVSSL